MEEAALEAAATIFVIGLVSALFGIVIGYGLCKLLNK